MRVAHFGTFDVENYGDLLFPLILERRLSDVCDEVVHVSPAGGPPVWEDCVPTVGFDEFLESPGKVDGVVIGGGQIIRTASTSLEVYDRGGVTAFTTYPSLWLGAAYVAAQNNVPLCWNAPGVSAAFGPVASELLRWTASVTDYLAVRDEAGRDSLQRAGVSQEIAVAPDTAAEVSALWPEEEISGAYRRAFERHGRQVSGRTIVFHVNSRWLDEKASGVAARIDRICKNADAAPVLLAIGPCHGDDEVQRRVSCEMSLDALVIDRPRSLLEVTACIARSEAYFGSSLHGMVAALSFGTGGILVASREDNKYDGFLDHLDLSSRLVGSWAGAEKEAGELFAGAGGDEDNALRSLRQTLDEHWSRLREILTGHAEDSPQDDKRDAVERLEHIGEDRYKNSHVFRPLLVEKLEESRARTRELLRERQKSRRLEGNLLLLRHWMETIDEAAQDLWNSRQWKAGRAVGEIQRRLLRRRKEWGAQEQIESRLQKFRSWNRKFEKPKEDDED